MDQSRPLFVYFRSFHIPIQMTNIQFEKSIDGVLGTRSQGGWMEGADKSTELMRHHIFSVFGHLQQRRFVQYH